MLSYTLSKREKALLLILAIVIIGIAWFVLVFQRTTNEIYDLDSQIATIDTNVATASAKVGRMKAMEKAIDDYEAAGVSPKVVPSYDNMTPLMSELNGIMSKTAAYTLSFDALDFESSKDYVLRGVTVDYSCDSLKAAEEVVGDLANGKFPCSIDSVSISDKTAGARTRVTSVAGAAPVSASVHITFFEKRS